MYEADVSTSYGLRPCGIGCHYLFIVWSVTSYIIDSQQCMNTNVTAKILNKSIYSPRKGHTKATAQAYSVHLAYNIFVCLYQYYQATSTTTTTTTATTTKQPDDVTRDTLPRSVDRNSLCLYVHPSVCDTHAL